MILSQEQAMIQEMARNFALEPDDMAQGYVLTCQSTPLTPTLAVDYDA